VLQEIGLAKKAVVLCGSYRVPWESFILATFDRKDNLLGYRGDCPPILRLPMNGKLPIEHLYPLLEDARGCHSTDPRDKVFALFGLLNGCQDEGLDADYTKSSKVVFTETAEFLIKKFNTLDVLFAVEPRTSSLESLPSWAPDWSVIPSTRFVNKAIRTYQDAPMASVYFTWLEDQCIDVNTSKMERVRVLHTTGYQLGIVSSKTIDETKIQAHHNLASRLFDWLQTFSPEKPTWIQTLTSLVGFGPIDFSRHYGSLEIESHILMVRSIRNILQNWILECMFGFPFDGIHGCLFITPEGRIGLGPASTQIGDILCRLHNFSSLCLLRRDTKGYYSYVGHCLGGFRDNESVSYEKGEIPLILQPDLYSNRRHVLMSVQDRLLAELHIEPEKDFTVL
jgi:hypothetical protein